jgi:prepilin-type N-terminal cleavage/methylation domain-containing protein
LALDFPAHRRMNPGSQSAFTLIELVVTLLILTMLTTVALRSSSGLQDQARYEQTRERLQMIREAILGDPRKTVNGQAVVSGFVADMGRLPNNIHELLGQGYCNNDQTKTTEAACGASWVYLPSYNTFYCTVPGNYTSADCTTAGGHWYTYPGNLGVGWRGPYLQTSQNPNHTDAFTDGWGREGVDDPLTLTFDERQSYGWDYFDLSALTGVSEDHGNLIVQSFGANRKWDNAIPAAENYDNDFPPNQFVFNATRSYPDPLVKMGEWHVNISQGVTATFSKTAFMPPLNRCSLPGYQNRSACEQAGGIWLWGCGKDDNNNTDNNYNSKNACLSDSNYSWRSCSNSSYVNKADCEANNALWFGNGRGCPDINSTTKAAITTKAECGASWKSCSNATDTTRTDCETNGALWFGEYCSNSTDTIRTDCESHGAVWHSDEGYGCNPYKATATKITCESTWIDYSRSLCMRIYYRSNQVISTVTGDAVAVEDGTNSSVTFKFPSNQQLITAGDARVGIYYKHGTQCSKRFYPDGHQLIPVVFYANSALPIIAW